jgi:pimeloyl-ACP methyl ester carboxylesterase
MGKNDCPGTPLSGLAHVFSTIDSRSWVANSPASIEKGCAGTTGCSASNSKEGGGVSLFWSFARDRPEDDAASDFAGRHMTEGKVLVIGANATRIETQSSRPRDGETRRGVLATVVGFGVAGGLTAGAEAKSRHSSKEGAMSTATKKPSIVFAHGLWADGSCFGKLIPTLQAEGYEVISSQHGLDSLKSDVDCVKRCIARAAGPVVLVGHSYGGALITYAGTDDRVAALVYLAAVAPDETETAQSQLDKFPKSDVFSHLDVAEGRIWMRPDGTAAFCGDLSETEQKLVWATQGAPVPDLLNQKHDGVAWKSKPSWYVVGTKDRTVQPDFERFVAKRMGAKTVELDSSHVPMLSKPEAVLDVIRDAAKQVASR